MKPRIAILLNGGPTDPNVSVCAVQLAVRTEGRLYAIQDCRFNDSDTKRRLTTDEAAEIELRILDSFRSVTSLARSEGVEISCHFLGDYLMGCYEKGQPEDFLIAHAITCLVVSAGLEKMQNKRLAWLNGLQERFYFAPRQFYSNFHIILAPSWENLNMDMSTEQFQHHYPAGENA